MELRSTKIIAFIIALALSSSVMAQGGEAPLRLFTGWLKYYPYLSDTSKYLLPKVGGDSYNGRYLRYIALGGGDADSSTWSQITLTTDVTGILPVGNGGTGATTLTDGGLLLGSGTGAITPLGQATDGQIPIGATGFDPVLGAITGTASEIDVTNGAGTIQIGLVNPLIVAKGGTGGTLFTDGGILLGSGTGAITNMSVLGNGALVVGDGTTAPNALAMGTANQALKVNAGGTAIEWGAISGTADGAGPWDTSAATPYRDTLGIIVVAGDTLLGIRKNGTMTEVFPDLSSSWNLKLKSNGGITADGGPFRNRWYDTTEVTNTAETGPGWLALRWNAADSGHVVYPREGGDAFEGMVPKYKKVPSATAYDTSRWAVPVETSADVAAGAIDLTTDPTGVLPAANGGTGTAMTNGQLLIGDGSGVPTIASLTAGSNITITPGAGSITIASTGGGGGAGIWDTTTTDPDRDTIAVQTAPAGGDTLIGIRRDGTTTEFHADVSTGGALRLNGNIGRVLLEFGSVDSAQVMLPRVIGTDGYTLKYDTVNSSGTAVDTFRYAVAVETSSDITNQAVQVVDLATDNATGSIPIVRTIQGVTTTSPVALRGWGGIGVVTNTTQINDTMRWHVNTDNVTLDTTAGNLLQVKDAGISLTTKVTGTLPVANGGTGAATLGDAGVLIGNGTGAVQVTSAGTAGQVLTSNGAGVDPTFQAAAGGGTAKGRISVWDATELDDSGAVTTGSGIGSTINLTPSPNTINVWVDPDGATMDTTGGKVKIKDAGVGLTQAGNSLPYLRSEQEGTAVVFDERVDLTSNGSINITGNNTASPNTAEFGVAINGIVNANMQDNSVGNAEMIDNAIGGLEMRDTAIAGEHMLYRRVEYDLSVVGVRAWNYGSADSMTLSMPTFGDNRSITGDGELDSIGMFDIFVDSTFDNGGNDTDWVMVAGVVPEDILLDSIYISYRTLASEALTATGTVAKIDSVSWRFRSSATDYTQIVIAPTGGDGTDQVGSITAPGYVVAKYAIAGTTIYSGTRILVGIKIVLGSDNASLRCGYVHVVGRKR